MHPDYKQEINTFRPLCLADFDYQLVYGCICMFNTVDYSLSRYIMSHF